MPPKQLLLATFPATLLAPVAAMADHHGEELETASTDEAKAEAAAPEVFGIAMGQPVESLSIDLESERTPHVYYLDPPSDHPEIDLLSVFAPPATGVCSVVMSVSPYEKDRYGRAAMADYNRRKAELIDRFGKPSETDTLRRGSRWKDADEYALSFWHGDRKLSSKWELNGSQGYSSISLWMSANKPDALYVLVNYKFSNYETCSSAPVR
ncbi:hypothetical protein KUW15_00325 [Qipengyuania aquimaris]|uniref:hypothetical protein n=1 Tax=Qipengyuania aquimaris TaxID=255984 RepID=UPI001C9796DD|nr:hypothetical protein [Qipengyuania aquimaris]MBY6127150.1 hypothetical protein [Qipengyuania aquimaris]